MGIKNIKSGLISLMAGAALIIAPGTALAGSRGGDDGNIYNKCHKQQYVWSDNQTNSDNQCDNGGYGGGPKDCHKYGEDNDMRDCKQQKKDCDNDYDNSQMSECQQPQKDCDNDYDNSPASECNTGGMGGGPTTGSGGTTSTTTTTTPQVLGASTTVTTGGLGAGTQVALVPTGSVNGGSGAASKAVNRSSAIGLVGALLSIGSGFVMLNRRNN
jgi:hypothetical protein